MRTRTDIESYLMRSGLPYEEVEGKDLWLIEDPASSERVVISLAGPLILFRVRVMEIEQVERTADMFRLLLELNASEMVHGAYGISGGAVVLTCALRMEDLDYNEFQAVIDDFSLAFSNHYDLLAGFREAA
ncbi:MAG: YbjN domain-containing protein [Myxococcales bacterium]|nr:YbjN domain-containing protein [Myxococcales bacterium]